MDFDPKGVMQAGERWDGHSVVLMNLLDLGTTVTREGETNRPTIVLPRREPGLPPGPDDRERPRFSFGTNEPPPPPPGLIADAASATNAASTNRPERFGPPRGGRPPRM